MMYNIFISYRRDGGYETAKHLYDLLTRDGYKVSFDIDTLQSGDFDKQIYNRIEECNDFILILDKNAFVRTLDTSFRRDNDWLRLELAYALEKKKNIVPIMLGNFVYPPVLPDDIERVRYKNSPAYAREYFDSFYAKLKAFLVTVPEVFQAPTDLNSKMILKVKSDMDCAIYVDDEKVTEVVRGKIARVPLGRGSYSIKVVSRANSRVFMEQTYEALEVGIEKIFVVKLLEQVIPFLDRNEGMIDCFTSGGCGYRYMYSYEGKYYNQIIIDAKYDEGWNFKERLARVELDGEYGFIDKMSNVIIPIIYDVAYDFNEGIALVGVNDKYGFIDKLGNEIIPIVYDNIEHIDELGLFRLELDGKYGFIDERGNESIPVKYDKADYLKDGIGLIALKLDGKYGFVGKLGREVTPIIFDEVWNINERFVCVKRNGKYGYIDNNGKEVITIKYDNISYSFTEGAIQVKLNGKWGLIDQNGKEISPMIYDSISEYSDGLARVEIDGRVGFVDELGNEAIPLKYSDAKEFSQGLAAVKLGTYWGYIDKLCNQITSIKYDFAYPFKEGFAVVVLDGKCGFVNRQGSEITPLKYDSAKDFSEILKGLARIRLEGRNGYIDKNGRERWDD